MIDLSRLTSEQRGLWDETFPDGFPEGGADEGPGFLLWSFGYISMLELGEVPKVVVEKMQELGIHDQPLEYIGNMRRKIEAQRRDA